MATVNQALLLLICLALSVTVFVTVVHEQKDKDEDDISSPGHFGRHLLNTDDDETGSEVDEEGDGLPQPELLYEIISPSFPYVDGGEELMYKWQLNHRVEHEHTAVTVSCEVDVPYSTFNPDSVNITISSFAFELNETRIEPLKVEYVASEEKVLVLVDLSGPLWVNLTEPWKQPECAWTNYISCYETDFTDCVFVDLSPEQNWDPEYCHQLNVDDCIPHNATSQCYHVVTEQCLTEIQESLGTPELTRCNLVPNTTCAQANDRGLFFRQYDWTRPTTKPRLTSYERDLCDMSNDDLWVYEETIEEIVYIVDLFMGTDEETGCTKVKMAERDPPEIVVTTYDPYVGLPTTDKYLRARDCLSVNTSGYYTPPEAPIEWKDFNLTILFTGVFSNYALVNQQFTSGLAVNITQVTKRPLEQLTNTSASLDYEVLRPVIHLNAEPTFSKRHHALKHEKIYHNLWIIPPHAIGFGIQVTVTFEDLTKMTFLPEAPTWTRGGDMVRVTEGPMFNETHDESGHVVLFGDLMEYMTRSERPELTHSWVYSNDTPGHIDALEVAIPPLIGVVDGARDVFRLKFASRVLTTVTAGDVLKLPQTIVVNSELGRYAGGGPPKLTVTVQPFVPLISAIDAPILPDTGDDFGLTFDLSQTLEFSIFDIWMNVSCPDLTTVPETLALEFLEPVNVTTESAYDEAIVMEMSLHFHLTELDPLASFSGNQTFHMWDNSMLTHQSVSCQFYLSYRREGKDLVLPYEAADIEVFTLPGIIVEVYEKELLENTTMYEMAIGSNATFVVDIAFPETSTELDITLTMPSPVLAVYSSFVTHNGSNLVYNGTSFEIQPLDDDIGTWPMGPRTVAHLNFGLVTNYADNQDSFQGDHLVFEFNCVLRDTETVVMDSEHSLMITVAYSGSPDLEQEMSVSVLEPDISLVYRLTNDSLDGDPGDVFEYSLFLAHTTVSQTPAHHVFISFYLPYMGVYRDFTPSNDSLVPDTTITDGLGFIEADSMLQLYVYKLELGEYISGTFLIKISTKLTEGVALMATANFSAESFYQWGRPYPYTTVSENVIDIRNATLYFMGTSQPQTRGENVTIHEQLTYRLYIPLPPIATNLTLILDLPQREITMKRWEAEKMRSEIPHPPPVEETFYEQGCLRRLHPQECYCIGDDTAGESLESLLIVLDGEDPRCSTVTKENCTTLFNDTASAILRANAVADCEVEQLHATLPVPVNCTGVENCTAASSNETSHVVATTNCSATVGEFDVEHELCDFYPRQVDLCRQSASDACRSNPEIARKWPFVTFHTEIMCNETEEGGPNGSLNCTNDAGQDCDDPGYVTGDPTTIPPEFFSSLPTDLPETMNINTSANGTGCREYTAVDCAKFADDFCTVFAMKNCSAHVLGEAGNSSYNITGGHGTTCFCNDVPQGVQESRWIESPYYICESLSEGGHRDAPNATAELCNEEETLRLSVGEVIHTEITSTREGAVCYFVGGNRHDPFSAGVTYFVGHLPANDTDVGDSVSAFVTMVILDDQSLYRGDILTLEGTSIFSYVTYPTRPPSTYRENCTCSRLLTEYTDPDALIDCTCETTILQSINQSDCNFTSTFSDTDTPYPPAYTCGCISYCNGNVIYFQNPLGSFNVMTFDPEECDCSSLDTRIGLEDADFLAHMSSCGQVHRRNYTCDTFNVTVSHEELVLVQNCSCHPSVADLMSCICDGEDIAAKVGLEFDGGVYMIDGCENGTISGDLYEFVLKESACVCPDVSLPPRYCLCSIVCDIDVEEESLDHEAEGHSHHIVQYHDNLCECTKIYHQHWNVSSFLNWVQTDARSNLPDPLDSSFACGGNQSLNSSSCESHSASANESSPAAVLRYHLDCHCFTMQRMLMDIPQGHCQEISPVEVFDAECFTPPDNATQFILDNWDENATIIDQMVTVLNHSVVIVEPELQVTFTRHPEPSIVDRIDKVAFDFEVTHTDASDAPAFNVHLLLDAINFTRDFAVAELSPASIYSDEHCLATGNLCQDQYSNAAGLFHLPYLPVEPPGMAFGGTFNLSVGNEIDFVADSLLTAASFLTYDSCVVDFPGRPYGPINASDTVQVDAPTISAMLIFSTAYSHLFYSLGTTDIPQVFSVGDYVRVKALLWVPEITLHLANLTISSDMTNVTVIYGEVFLTEQIWNRNDTGSIYQELATDEGELEGLLYYGIDYAYSNFENGGVTIVPGVIINDADNVADDEDYLAMTLTFRVNDVPSWVQGEKIQFLISATYLSDYPGYHVTLVDESVNLMMVEPLLSLRVEILDHQYLVDQITNAAEYTCQSNTCCGEVSCDVGEVCLTDVENREDCASAECLCYSGYASHEEGGCSAVGRTAGDIVSFGITVTHDVDFTGNAFDVTILVRSSLPASLLPEAHFISHPPPTGGYIETLSVPLLTQTSEDAFTLYIQRFNYVQSCERFSVPFRVDPTVRLRAGELWHVNTSLSYYSAKPYDISQQMNQNSRFYKLEGDTDFVFRAPAPSAAFYMMPTVGNSTEIDFRVYASSDENHTITINLAQERTVRFQLEAVVPKVETDLSILLSLPEGDAFTFLSAQIVSRGSRVEVSQADTIETTDLDGKATVYIPSVYIYSSPEVLNSQRPLNGTIQRQFKTMLGETQPYPAEPGCDEVNSTSYENPLVYGCFNDSVHFMPVTMVTEDHPTNGNRSLAMTNKLCFELCRQEGFYVFGTKNGSDCYCGNFTALRAYQEVAGSIFTLANTTVQEPHMETTWAPCNKTGVTWSNRTLNHTCHSASAYQGCVAPKMEACSNTAFAECTQNYLDTIDCESTAANWCNGSMELDCESIARHNCSGAMYSICSAYSTASCDLLSTNGSIHTSCLAVAEAVASNESASACRVARYAECYPEEHSQCQQDVMQSCIESSKPLCTTNWAFEGYPYYMYCVYAKAETCSVAESASCANHAAEICSQQDDTCAVEQILSHNVSVVECRDAFWDGCAVCMYEAYIECTDDTLETTTDADCTKESVAACLELCLQENCTTVFYETYTEYVYPVCAVIHARSSFYTYESNCSVEVETFREVYRNTLIEEKIPLTMCNVPCTGDATSSCGGEGMVLLSGVLEQTLVEQKCDWYAGLYEQEEDTVVWEFELKVDALATKGVTELLQPLISYTHGPERTLTLIPFAPFRLEAGRLELLMDVWVSPKLSGYQPGDLLEYYTEVRHHSTSTITARDVTVWWIFPTYVEFVNLTNHVYTQYEYRSMQSVTATSTDPSQGIVFHLLGLENTDMISFHFVIRLDPERTLPAGEYNLVAFAEMDYFSWDIYNPHEDGYRYNTVPYYHDPELTRVEFNVKPAPISRPEREDVQLKMYSFLYDEDSNLFYACFFNRTGNRKKGGCFMTGDLPLPSPDPYPTCEGYCNCTFEYGVKDETNCTSHLPRPDNCTSCGCYPDCEEELLACDDACMTCQDCNTTVCSAACSLLYQNCSTSCCEDDCRLGLGHCINGCSTCNILLGCTVESCTTDCGRRYDRCYGACHPTPWSCQSNCTAAGELCTDGCHDDCSNITASMDESQSSFEYLQLEVLNDCVAMCRQDCITTEENCTRDCCIDDCDNEWDFCSAGCMRMCRSDALCVDDCTALLCNASRESCVLDCALSLLPCAGRCDLLESVCAQDCPVECDIEVCTEEVYTSCQGEEEFTTEALDANFTLPSIPDAETTVRVGVTLPDNAIPEAMSSSFTTESTNTNFTSPMPTFTTDDPYNASISCRLERREVCSVERTTACNTLCVKECAEVAGVCMNDCCIENCTNALTDCQYDCAANCSSDEVCLKFCDFLCGDDFEICAGYCYVSSYECRSDCEFGSDACEGECVRCQALWNQTDSGDMGNATAVGNGTGLVCSCSNSTNTTAGGWNLPSFDGNCTCNTTNRSHWTEACGRSNLSECMSWCDSSVSECSSACPCEEDCHLDVAECWGSCTGCHRPCYDGCYSNCANTTKACEDSCTNDLRLPVLTNCLDSCRNICASNCANGNGTIDTTCLLSCSLWKGNCTLSCIGESLLPCQEPTAGGSDNGTMTTDLPTWESTFSFTTNVFMGGVSTATDIFQVGGTAWPLAEEETSTVLSCASNCSEDHFACVNTTIGGLLRCSAQHDACIERCLDNYTRECCSDKCTSHSDSCNRSCSVCDACLIECKSSCNSTHNGCLSICQSNTDDSGFDPADCDGYAACTLACPLDALTQECAAECLDLHLGCSSAGDCPPLDVCINPRRRRRSLLDWTIPDSSSDRVTATTTASDLINFAAPANNFGDDLEDRTVSISIYRRRRDVGGSMTNGSVEDDFNTTDSDTDSICIDQYQFEQYLACKELCMNVSSAENGWHTGNVTSCMNDNFDWPGGVDSCDDLIPSNFTGCLSDCQRTSSFCNESCQDCSNSQNCSTLCDLCDDDLGSDSLSECQEMCGLSMYHPNCSDSCDPRNDSTGSISWDCDCSDRTLLSANQECPEIGWTNSSSDICVVDYQLCSCNCSFQPVVIKFNWRRLHLSVANILGSVNSSLYGLARNGRAVMVSRNHGETWSAITDAAWSNAQSSLQFIPAQRVDWADLSTAGDEQSPVYTYLSGVWGRTYRVSSVGIHYQPSSDWSEFWDTLGIWRSGCEP